jgi:serine/threonine-protein kinase
MPAPQSIIGRILGGYVVQTRIGVGGMGEVYRAHDDRLNRTVAIKILPAKFRADAVLRERFLREGRTAARIDHPNVVRILSAGEENDLPYLVMEYVDGGSLQGLLEKRVRLPAATTARIVRSIALALAAAHRVGVLHRDVKPANVLFTKGGEPKLVDFGLAREEQADHNLSQTGMVMGTPHYMAPEVCEGKRADARADIYSLGVMAFAMVAQKLPFDGETPIAILLAHLQKPVPPMPDAPKPVADAIRRALEKDPSKRWQSAADFAAALERAGGDRGGTEPALPPRVTPSPPAVPSVAVPVAASSTPSSIPLPSAPGGLSPTAETPTSGLPARRRPFPLLLAAVCGGAAALLIAGLAWFGGGEKPAKDRGQSGAGDAGPASEGDSPPLTDTSADWVESFRIFKDEANERERSDDYVAALEVWSRASPPDSRWIAAVARERNDVLGRARLRADAAIAGAVPGAKGAKSLKELARKMPKEAADRLDAAALQLMRDWAPRDGLPSLRLLAGDHDVATLEAHLERLPRQESETERETLALAKQFASSLRRVLEEAWRWYADRSGEEAQVRFADQSMVAAAIEGVDERGLRLKARGRVLTIGPGGLATAELLTRALDGCPSEATLRAALDVALVMCEPPESWPFLRHALRRGIAPTDRQKEMLDAHVAREDAKAVDTLCRKLDAERKDPAAAAQTARELLRKYGEHPLYNGEHAYGREQIRAAGGPVSQEDFRLFLAGAADDADGEPCLRYGHGDALFTDFGGPATADVVPGRVLTVRPRGDGAYLRLDGLDYADLRLSLEGRFRGDVAALLGARGDYEHFAVVISQADETRRCAILPVDDTRLFFPTRQGDFDTIEISLSGDSLSVTANGAAASVRLPARWAGQVGFYLGGETSVRSLRLLGRPTFAPEDAEEEAFSALEDAAGDGKGKPIPASFGAWAQRKSRENELAVDAQERPTIVRPPAWTAGDDYVVEFSVTLGAEAELVLDLRSGGPQCRRIVFGAQAWAGFVSEESFMHGGTARRVASGREHEVEVQVKGNLGQVLVGGKTAWRGHLGPARRGGVSVGARKGKAVFKDLEVRALR